VDDLANSCHADPAQIIEVGPSNHGFSTWILPGDTVDGRNPAPVDQ